MPRTEATTLEKYSVFMTMEKCRLTIPFVNTPGAKPEIWSYGHRNLQGLYYDKTTGILWEHEHGPRGGDELNIVEKGKNYGWPVITYGINYDSTIITDLKEKEGHGTTCAVLGTLHCALRFDNGYKRQISKLEGKPAGGRAYRISWLLVLK